MILHFSVVPLQITKNIHRWFNFLNQLVQRTKVHASGEWQKMMFFLFANIRTEILLQQLLIQAEYFVRIVLNNATIKSIEKVFHNNLLYFGDK